MDRLHGSINIVGSPSLQVHVHDFKRLCIRHVKIMPALDMGILFPCLCRQQHRVRAYTEFTLHRVLEPSREDLKQVGG